MTQGDTVDLQVRTVLRSGVRLFGLVGLNMVPQANWWLISASGGSSGWVTLTALSPGVVTLTLEQAEAADGFGFRVYPTQTMNGNLQVTIADDIAIADLPAETGTPTAVWCGAAADPGAWVVDTTAGAAGDPPKDP